MTQTINLIYTLEILNAHTVSLSGITVTDSLPAEVSFVSSMPPAIQTNGNQFVFDLGTLETNSNAVITIEVAVTSTVPGVITNVAFASTTNINVSVTAQVATAETLLYIPTDLHLIKTASLAGSNVTYTVTVSNRSVSAAANVMGRRSSSSLIRCQQSTHMGVDSRMSSGWMSSGAAPLAAAASMSAWVIHRGRKV